MSFFILSMDDQKTFSDISGDHNPLHVDPVHSRRLLTGAPVANGIYLVLLSLERYLENHEFPGRLTKLKCSFMNPIEVGSRIKLEANNIEEQQLSFVISRESGLQVAHIEGEFTLAPASDHQPMNIPDFHKTIEIKERRIEDVEGLSGSLGLFFNPTHFSNLFPALSHSLEPGSIADLLAITRLVGMECPGLHSLFAKLDLEFVAMEGSDPELNYRVEKADLRFSILHISTRSPFSQGTIKAFFRPLPFSQMNFAEAQKHVRPMEFQNENVLIIGGSRGLGEATVKIYAAGGANVTFSYFKGTEEAKHLCTELPATTSFSLNVTESPPVIDKAIKAVKKRPSILFYFATPFIFNKTGMLFSQDKFERFCDYYINGLYKIVRSIRDMGPGPLTIINPSSVAVTELPNGMAEYASAKSSSETLCQYLETVLPDTKFFCPRLPRINTDQTVSILPEAAEDSFHVMLNLIRSLSLEMQKE